MKSIRVLKTFFCVHDGIDQRDQRRDGDERDSTNNYGDNTHKEKRGVDLDWGACAARRLDKPVQSNDG